MKVAHEEQRDPGDAFKRAAIGFYLAHHLKLAGFFPPESDYMTDSAESSSSNKDGFFSVKNQTVVTIVTLLVSNDEILVTGFHFLCCPKNLGCQMLQFCLQARTFEIKTNSFKQEIVLFLFKIAELALDTTDSSLVQLCHVT